MHMYTHTWTHIYTYMYTHIYTQTGKVYKRALVVPPSSPHQRTFVCGACTGTAQVGVLLVSLFDPLFKQCRLHCFDVCLTSYLWHIRIWWQYLVPTWRVYTPPRYATIPKLTCWHVVSLLWNIDHHHPGTPPYPSWSVDMSCLFCQAWWQCVSTSPDSGKIPTPCTRVVPVPTPGVVPVPTSCPCCFVVICAHIWSRSR